MKTGYVCIDGQYYAPNHPFVKRNQDKPLLHNVDFVKGELQKKKRIRQSSKPLLNKLEWDFFDSVLRPKYGMINIHAQAMRFKLGNGIWYKVDFVVFDKDIVRAYEIKGPFAHRGGFENLKVAASLYIQITWYLVWKENGQWQEQQILP